MGNSRLDSLEAFSQPHQPSHLTFVPSSLNFSSPPHNNNSKSPHLAHLPSSCAPPCPLDPQFPLHNQQTPPFKSFSADPILQLNNASELVHSRAVVEILREDDPNLQLKHGSSISPTDFCPHSGAPFGGLLNGGSSAMVPLRTDNTPPSVARAGAFGEQNSSIIIPVSPLSSAPLTTVSGSQTTPFTHKLDSRDRQTLGFASFSGDGGERDRARSRESVEKVKKEYMGECLVKVCEGGYNTHVKICENITVKGKQEAVATIASLEDGGMGVPVASLEDGGMGLRLGKRMYYGDAGRPQEAVRRANSNSNGGVKNGSSKSSASNSSTNNQNSITLTANNGGGGNTNKKHKSSSATTVVPKCQVEGCKADLSGARDYHRRHKVCEWHSKASKAKVNNLEQRFCQQCSRFHVLSEFDEGKRSCRRRLAGHNERRRKPPPEPMPFLLPGSFTYLADSTINGSLLNHPFFVQHRRASPLPVSIDNALLACQLGLAEFPQQETLGNYHALERHHFLDGLPPGGGSGLGVLDGGRALMMAGGHMLSNPLEPSPSTSSPVGLVSNGSTEMAISGRALSLLSSSLTSSENPSAMAISLGMASPTIDQFLPENHVLASSHQVAGSSTSCFSSAVGMASTLHGIGHNHNSNALHSLTSSSSGCSTDVDQGEPPAMSSFDGHSMFLINSESGFQNLQDGTNPHQHGRPVLDLMQVASDTHLDHPQSEIMYGDYHRLSIFGQPSIM